MNKWIRRFYILLTVGGGFLGVSLFVGQMLRSSLSLATYVFFGGFVLIFACGVVAGLYFIEREKEGLRFVALYLVTQVPIVSSPILAYQMSSGFTFRVALIGPKFLFYGGIGSDASVWILGDRPWGLGVNVVALTAVIYAVRMIWRQSKKAEPGATDNPDDAHRLREDH